MISTAKRIESVEEYYFSLKLKEIALMNAAGSSIINLGIGSPDLPPHETVLKTLETTSKDSKAHAYQSYYGLSELKHAIHDWYQQYFGINLKVEKEILPLIGSKEGIMHISMTYLEAGDEVLIPNPGYPAYSACAALTGATIRLYDLEENNNWEPKLAALEASDLSKVKIMWVNYPHMPTGALGSKELFQRLKSFGERHHILICHDNPYSFILNAQPESIFSAGKSDYLLELNSLSKSHNMAGWRIGMILGAEKHLKNILKFKSNMDSGMFKPLQLAAATAVGLGESWYFEQNKVYYARKAVVLEILQLLSCQVNPKQVGLFVWAKVPESVPSVIKWADQILYEAKVFIVPGEIFGSQGKRYIRISLCATSTTLHEALERISEWKNQN